MEKYPNTKPFPIEHKIEPNNFASAVPGKYTNLKLPIVVDQRNIRNGNICDQCTYEIIIYCFSNDFGFSIVFIKIDFFKTCSSRPCIFYVNLAACFKLLFKYYIPN